MMRMLVLTCGLCLVALPCLAHDDAGTSGTGTHPTYLNNFFATNLGTQEAMQTYYSVSNIFTPVSVPVSMYQQPQLPTQPFTTPFYQTTMNLQNQQLSLSCSESLSKMSSAFAARDECMMNPYAPACPREKFKKAEQNTFEAPASKVLDK